jgi:FG-GAP repeat protein/hemolysin type calcium-binding protein
MAYPAFITLSSLDGSNGFVVHGAFSGDASGVSVSAGDVNGDGFDDLIIGARDGDPGVRGGAGQTYVVFGAASGLAAAIDLSLIDGATSFRLNGVDANDQSGGAVSSAGDINNDGYDDMVIGARNADSAYGEAYLVFGKETGWTGEIELSALNGADGFRMDGSTVNWGFTGHSVAAAGDVDNDGYDDFIVSAVIQDAAGGRDRGGQSYLIYGSADPYAASYDLATLSPAVGFTINGRGSDFETGQDVASAGDVNGDGFDDLVVTSLPAGGYKGQTYVVFGKAKDGTAAVDLNTLTGANGFVLAGTLAGDNAGTSVASADLNGDGYSDLLIGATGADPNGTSSGATYVVFGKAGAWDATTPLANLDAATGLKIQGIAAQDFSGISVNSAGDFNGDGFEDIIVGAYGADPVGGSAAGQAYVVFGKATGWTGTLNLSSLDGTNGFRLDGPIGGDNTGLAVSSGDVNGDGLGDLIIGAPGADPLSRAGAGDTYVVYGSRPDEAVVRTGSSIDQAIYGSAFDDALSGLGGDDLLDGGDGDDTLNGGDGHDTLAGGLGRDVASYAGATAGVTINLGDAAAQDTGGSGIDLLSDIEDLIGSASRDNLSGDGANNLLRGGDGADTLSGGDGADTLAGGEGDDLLAGNDGVDTADYSAATAAIAVNLGYNPQDTGGAGTDTLLDIDNLIGSAHDDALTGDDGANQLEGGDGADSLAGGDGDDTLAGGDGLDTADYSTASTGVTVSLAATAAQNTGAGLDLLTGIEALVGSASDDVLGAAIAGGRLDGEGGDDLLTGSYGADTLDGGAAKDRVRGGSGADELHGGNQNDAIHGGNGDDIVSGDGGKDKLWGDDGADRFVFAAVSDTAAGKQRDIIQDFVQGVDVIDLSAIDANGAEAGDAAFAWLDGEGFTGAGAELTYITVNRGVIVMGDIDGDTIADFEIRIAGATTAEASDLVL